MNGLSRVVGVWLTLAAGIAVADGHVDTHVHLDQAVPGGFSTAGFGVAAEQAIAEMDRLGIAWSVLLPTPQAAGRRFYYDYEELLPVVRRYPDRFAFLGGGGSLNVMIQEAVAAGRTDEALRARFRKRAEAIIAAGAAGFGEMAALHFGFANFHANHPYLYAPPDHELLLLLADIAAAHGLVIDLHMEAVPQEMPLPAIPILKSPPNPSMLSPNLAAFERLLAHNRGARIVWVHCGWDWLGTRTVARTRELIARHPNLYLSLEAVFPRPVFNRPLDAEGRLKEEWVALIGEFPDRFMIGSDEFYRTTDLGRRRAGSLLEPTVSIVEQLPAELARRVGHENAQRLYRRSTP